MLSFKGNNKRHFHAKGASSWHTQQFYTYFAKPNGILFNSHARKHKKKGKENLSRDEKNPTPDSLTSFRFSMQVPLSCKQELNQLKTSFTMPWQTFHANQMSNENYAMQRLMRGKTRHHGRHKEKRIRLKKRKESKNNQGDPLPCTLGAFMQAKARLQLDL